jgi:hypothetical protein
MNPVTEFARILGVPETSLVGVSDHHRNATEARFAVFYVLREQAFSLNAIARMFKVDHSSVHHGAKRFKGLLEIKDRRACCMYDLIKGINVNEMSEKQQILIINPPAHRQKSSDFFYAGFKCPACGGLGHSLPVQVGYDKYEQKECEFCGGTGGLEAHVRVKWVPENSKKTSKTTEI